jgi:hypothetical protein
MEQPAYAGSLSPTFFAEAPRVAVPPPGASPVPPLHCGERVAHGMSETGEGGAYQWG